MVAIIFSYISTFFTRPTMILYGIDNIRDLFGHKVKCSALRNFSPCLLSRIEIMLHKLDGGCHAGFGLKLDYQFWWDPLMLLWHVKSIGFSQIIRLELLHPYLVALFDSVLRAFAGGSLSHKKKPNMSPWTLMNPDSTRCSTYFWLYTSNCSMAVTNITVNFVILDG